jgi:hypothetical protein
MATIAVWPIMPCPSNRRVKIVRPKTQMALTCDMLMAANPSTTNSTGAIERTRKRSVTLPANTITAADAVVASAYSPPHCPCDRPNSARISPAKTEMKNVCPKLEAKVSAKPASSQRAF